MWFGNYALFRNVAISANFSSLFYHNFRLKGKFQILMKKIVEYRPLSRQASDGRVVRMQQRPLWPQVATVADLLTRNDIAAVALVAPSQVKRSPTFSPGMTLRPLPWSPRLR